jgi:regulator of sigma E protease
VYINQVESDSPAAAAGWQPGDAFVSVNGAGVETVSQLSNAIDGFDDQPVTVVVERGDRQIETTVTPRGNPPAGQGATGVIIVEGKNSFVQINQVDPGSPAEAAGVMPGDRITAINGIAVESEAQVGSLLNSGIGSSIELTVQRDGKPVSMTVQVPDPTVMITAVGQHTPAADALLYRGDQITRIGDISVVDATTFRQALLEASGKTVDVDYVREGKTGTVSLKVPELGEGVNPLEAIGLNARVENTYDAIGVNGLITPKYEKVPLTRVVPEGWNQFWGFMTVTVDGLKQMATEGVDRDQIAGPVGMGQITSELLSESVVPAWFTITFIMVVISVGLGVLNLLPIPALDGGRLLFVIIEILRGGKRISPEKEGMVHLAGMVILLALMFLVAFGDVSRLLDGRSMLP